MKILGIDSSGLVATVAVVEDDNLLGEYTVNYEKKHSETLLPMIDTVAKMIDLDLSTLDLIAVAKGPGSFTGLRIGSATAKGLGMALDIPLASVPTLDALAYNLWGAQTLVCPMMDARRQQVYTGLYRFVKLSDEFYMGTVLMQSAMGVDELVDKVNRFGAEVTFLGDGVPVYADYIKENCRAPYSFAPAHLNKQRASAVAALAKVYYREGKTETAEAHKPEYLRLSQAERERIERGESIDSIDAQDDEV